MAVYEDAKQLFQTSMRTSESEAESVGVCMEKRLDGRHARVGGLPSVAGVAQTRPRHSKWLTSVKADVASAIVRRYTDATTSMNVTGRRHGLRRRTSLAQNTRVEPHSPIQLPIRELAIREHLNVAPGVLPPAWTRRHTSWPRLTRRSTWALIP